MDNQRLLTGIEVFDLATGGLQSGDFWIHAAPTGGYKSALARKVAYHQVVHRKQNIVWMCLEESPEQVRASFLAMHGTHPKFYASRIRSGISPQHCHPRVFHNSRTGWPGFWEEVIADLMDPENGFGTVHVPKAWCIREIKEQAERVHTETPCSLIVVDSMAMLAADVLGPGEVPNCVTQELATICRHLNGPALLGLVQTRRGVLDADITDFPAEYSRLSDVFTRAQNSIGKIEVKFLKNRFGSLMSAYLPHESLLQAV